jgi:hypothetical protein
MTEKFQTIANQAKARRASEAIANRRVARRADARQQCDACEQFSRLSSGVGLWVPPDQEQRREQWLAAPSQRERCGEISPLHETWPAVNAAFALAWIDSHWCPLCEALRRIGVSSG